MAGKIGKSNGQPKLFYYNNNNCTTTCYTAIITVTIKTARHIVHTH